ncbi:MAG TPA: alanine racemase [Acidimicrobiales bacterium]|nr:alanine racemase [Acidimicrobiales bacterium]
MRLDSLTTPALVLDADVAQSNLSTMSAALPGLRLRPHVKAHKCTSLARRQASMGHTAFTCATIREAEGMASAGLGSDLLVANEVLDARRLGALVGAGHRVTLAVDSPQTVAAARDGGVREVLIDVNVGLPRCGVAPEEAGHLADLARRAGLDVRGVMGYEGHAVGLADRSQRAAAVQASAALLSAAHDEVGGDVISAGGTGSYDLNTVATEIQAGSYVLMDTAYGELGLPFAQALTVLATVISVNRSGGWAVVDCGLKALGMDHGNPAADAGTVWFCSDEHTVLTPTAAGELPEVGDRVQVIPAHCDPTVAYHEVLHLVRGDEVLERWPVDLRGW